MSKKALVVNSNYKGCRSLFEIETKNGFCLRWALEISEGIAREFFNFLKSIKN